MEKNKIRRCENCVHCQKINVYNDIKLKNKKFVLWCEHWCCAPTNYYKNNGCDNFVDSVERLF